MRVYEVKIANEKHTVNYILRAAKCMLFPNTIWN
jgi:hypothetical protein